jgi:hypothetical protein
MHRRPPSISARPLLASREHHSRYGDEQLARCLFLLDPREIRLIGAYLKGDLLDGQKAQRLCDAHQWAIHVQQRFKTATEGTRTTHQSGQSAPGVHAPPGLTWAIRLGLGQPLVLCRIDSQATPTTSRTRKGCTWCRASWALAMLPISLQQERLSVGVAMAEVPSHAVQPVPWAGEATRHHPDPESIRLRSSLCPQLGERPANRSGKPVRFGEHCSSTTVAAATMRDPADPLGHLLAAALTHRPS